MSTYQPGVMIDLETLGTSPRAAILALGACFFDLGGEPGEFFSTFTANISLESNARAGRKIEPSTVIWWLQQPKEAQNAFLEGPHKALSAVLAEFSAWNQQLSPTPHRVWAKDPDFDIVILRDAFQEDNRVFPYKYFMSRSVRTILDLAFGDEIPAPPNPGVAHSATDDAIKQVALVQMAFQTLVTM